MSGNNDFPNLCGLTLQYIAAVFYAMLVYLLTSI